MRINFRNLATLSALVCLALAITWVFAPNLLLSMWGVEFSYPVGFVGRRAAALYAAIGIKFFAARNAEPSTARSALMTGFVFGCLALATLGVFELVTGHAGLGILSAVFVEAGLALAFLYVLRTEPMLLQGNV
jgi:hypothetical protein